MFDKLNCIVIDLLIQFSPYWIWAICFVFLLCGAVSLDFYNTYSNIMPFLTLFTIVRFYRYTNGEQFFHIHPYGGGLYLIQGLIPWFLINCFPFIGLGLALIFLLLLHSFSNQYLSFIERNGSLEKIKDCLIHTKSWLK